MNTPSTSFRYTLKYSLLQGSYWPIICAVYNFSSVYLLSKGFTNPQIGIILALANIFAVILQPAIASYADTSVKISLKKLTVMLAIIAAVLSAAIFLLPPQFVTLSLLFTIDLALLLTLQPFVNSLGMQLINRGISFNFGLARGIGSISFAVFSYVIGFFIEQYEPDATMVIAMLLLFFFIFFTGTLPTGATSLPKTPTPTTEKSKSEASGKSLNAFAFMLRYKRFSLLLLAVSLTFTSHVMLNNYAMQIVTNVNGTAKNMGTAIAIAAAVELPAMALFTFFIRKTKCSLLLKLSLFFFCIKALIALLAPNVLVFYISQLFQFSAYAVFIPASIYYVNLVIDETDMIKGQAFMTGAISLGGVIGSFLGGLLLGGSGVRGMLIVSVVTSVLGFVISLPAIEKTSIVRD